MFNNHLKLYCYLCKYFWCHLSSDILVSHFPSTSSVTRPQQHIDIMISGILRKLHRQDQKRGNTVIQEELEFS